MLLDQVATVHKLVYEKPCFGKDAAVLWNIALDQWRLILLGAALFLIAKRDWFLALGIRFDCLQIEEMDGVTMDLEKCSLALSIEATKCHEAGL